MLTAAPVASLAVPAVLNCRCKQILPMWGCLARDAWPGHQTMQCGLVSAYSQPFRGRLLCCRLEQQVKLAEQHWCACSQPFSGRLLCCRYEQQVKRAEMFSKLVSNVSGKLDAAHTIDRGHITTITEADETSSPQHAEVNLAAAEVASAQTAQQAPAGGPMCPPVMKCGTPA